MNRGVVVIGDINLILYRIFDDTDSFGESGQIDHTILTAGDIYFGRLYDFSFPGFNHHVEFVFLLLVSGKMPAQAVPDRQFSFLEDFSGR